MARPVTTDAANTSSGPSFQPLFRNSVFTTSYVAIFVAPSTAARATVVPRPLYRPSTPSLAITSRPTWNMDGGGNRLDAAIWIMSRSVGEAMAAAPAPATRPAVIFFHTGSSSSPPLVSSATFKGSYKPKRSELYVASRNAAAENPRYKPLSPSLCQMEAVCANIPSGTSPRMPASCCCTIAVLVQCTVPCATTQLVPTNPKFSPICSGVWPFVIFSWYHGAMGLDASRGDGASAAIARDYPRADCLFGRTDDARVARVRVGATAFRRDREAAVRSLSAFRSDSKIRIGI